MKMHCITGLSWGVDGIIVDIQKELYSILYVPHIHGDFYIIRFSKSFVYQVNI